MAVPPGSTKSRRVRRRALLRFKIGAERRTVGRTGVLIYLSLFEHRAEIVADEAIHGRVEPEVWGDAMATRAEGVKAGRPGEGMASAEEKVGEVPEESLPWNSAVSNGLPECTIGNSTCRERGGQ